MKKLLCISLLFSFSLSSFAGSVLKYSINVNSEKHKDKMTGKNYYQGKMYRNEIEVPVNENGKTKNEKLISIIRLDKEIIWSLIPEQNGYVEFTFEDLKKAYKKGKELVPGDNISGFYQMECKKSDLVKKWQDLKQQNMNVKIKMPQVLAGFHLMKNF